MKAGDYLKNVSDIQYEVVGSKSEVRNVIIILKDGTKMSAEKWLQDFAEQDKGYIANEIIGCRNALLEKDIDEAWHHLYRIASPNYDKLCDDVWAELEQLADKFKKDEA